MKNILFFTASILFIACQEEPSKSIEKENKKIESIIDSNDYNNQNKSTNEFLKEVIDEELDEDKLRSVLWKELKDYKKYKVYMQTNKFKIWIDEKEDGSYRYASWPISKTLSQEPDLILYGGKLDYKGSEGNYAYTFTNANYSYKCVINELEKSNKEAYLIVKENEKELLSQKAYIISPFSNVIADTVMPNVLKNYEPGNYFYNEYSFIKLLYKYSLGGDMHPEGSSLNPSLKTRLKLVSGIDLVIGQDKNYIAHYNPAFFNWMVLNLLPKADLNIGNYTVAGYYQEKFSLFARKFISVYWDLEKKGFKQEAKKYRDYYTNYENEDVLYYLAKEYGKRVADEEWVDGMADFTFDLNAEWSGFWLRRFIHGTHDDIYKVLVSVLEKYDNYWFENAKLLKEHNLTIESSEMQEDAIKLIKNGFNLVNCYFISNTEEEANISGEHLYNDMAYDFEDCNGEKTYEIFTLYAGDHVSKNIPTLADNNWKAVENGSSLKVENPLPNGEFSWNSNLTMGKDSNGVLSSIYFDNRGMGGGYEISILRTGNSCKLKYFGFAD